MPESIESEPAVITKPETPFYKSPKFLGGMVVVLTLGFLAFLINSNIILKKPPTPSPHLAKTTIPDQSLICPLDGDVCDTNGNYQQSSLSADLSDPEPVYAVFDGILERQPQSDKNLTVVLLRKQDNGLMAKYSFVKGIAIGPAKVKAGDVIAVADSGKIPDTGKSFVFSLASMEGGGKNLLPLSPVNFK